MTPAAFYRLCRAHDWTHQFSDDHRVVRAGEEAQRRLALMASADDLLKPIWDKFLAWGSQTTYDYARIPTLEDCT